jgi:hypothetical protein
MRFVFHGIVDRVAAARRHEIQLAVAGEDQSTTMIHEVTVVVGGPDAVFTIEKERLGIDGPDAADVAAGAFRVSKMMK